jgi:hypothetical protein
MSLNKKQIKDTFESLAKSQGMYQRLLDGINELSEEDQKKFWDDLESRNFKDSVDVVLYMEE